MNRKRFQSILSLIVALAVLLTALPAEASVFHTEVPGVKQTTGRVYIAPKRPNVPASDSANRPVKRADNLPRYYNSNDLGLITSVKYQGSGDCWAHAAMASTEANMIKKGIPVGLNGMMTEPADTSLNLSESHHVLFAYGEPSDELGLLANDHVTMSKDPFDMGGHGYSSMFGLMRWIGPGNEATEALAYPDEPGINTKIDEKYAYAYDAAHIQNVVIIACSDRDAVKEAVMKYGAGDFSYCHEDEYENSNGAFFYPQEITERNGYYEIAEYANHAVTLVGWDDDYAVTNFLEEHRPENPGAWIIKNSWSSAYGDHGYYYISYEDTASYVESVFFYEAEPIDNFDHIYQYDGTTNPNADKTFQNGASFATVFTAFGDETLKAASIATWDDDVRYTLNVYLNPENSNPESGVLSSTVSGTLQYAGYQTIRLETPVKLTEGTRYALVFTLNGPESDLMLPVDYVGTRTDSYMGISYTHAEHENSCYIKESAGWIDNSARYNLRMKAYTDDIELPVMMSYHVNVGSAPEPVSGISGVTTIILPEPETVPDGWTFAGWARTPITETNQKPELFKAGDSFRLRTTINHLYAVYRKSSGLSNLATFSKTDALLVGDTVVLTADDASMELASFSTTSKTYGIGAAFTGIPAGIMELAVEQGTDGDSYAFRTGDQYLCWTGNNTLKLSDSITDNSSWYVAFENNNALIRNVSDSNRMIWWNHDAPRFAAYQATEPGNTFSYVQFYRKTGADTLYNSSPVKTILPGDLNEYGLVSADDAATLLYHLFFSEAYPLNQSADFDGSDTIDASDALRLLYHIVYPALYELNV